jgi:stage II sporulation protein D
MKKFFLQIATIISFVSLNSPAASAVNVPQSFTFTGSGYGHGVGLSQIGAKGQALGGKSATDILKYYFPGADVVPVNDSETIRVNIGHQLNSVSFIQSPNGSFQISSDSLTTTAIDTSSVVSFQISGKTISASAKGLSGTINQLGTSAMWNLVWGTGAEYVMEKFEGNTVKLNHGFISLRAVSVKGIGYRIEVTNSINLHDEYLWGISEVPSSWPEAALESQIIASRTYALSRMGSIRKDCDCHVYNTKYDQNFLGYLKEVEPKYGSIWKSAVTSTDVGPDQGLAITFQGQPITVYFFSSSGGITQRAIDVWGTDIPYLSSVPDPWSLDPRLNPKYFKWKRVVDQATMAQAFGLPDIYKYVIGKRTATGSVLTITGYSTNGFRKTLTVSAFKVAVKLPSSWFNIPSAVQVPDSSTTN